MKRKNRRIFPNGFPTTKKSTFITVLLLLLLIEPIQALQMPKPFLRNNANNNNNNFEPPQLEPEPQNILQPSLLQVIGMYGVAPAIPAVVLPILTDTFRATQNSSDLLTVLVAKRLFIYLIATLATVYAGWRASASISSNNTGSAGTGAGAGKSLDALNREILRGEPPVSAFSSLDSDDSEKEEEKRNDEIFATLDEKENVGQTLAFALPIFLTAALSVSYFLLQGGGDATDVSTASFGDFDVKEILNKFSYISNFAICLLFSAAEYRSSTSSATAIVTSEKREETLKIESNKSSYDSNITGNDEDESGNSPLDAIISIPNLIAFGAVMAAFFLPLSQAWPFQNSINIAIAVTVTRALAPFIVNNGNSDDDGGTGSLRIIALALTGLSVYDICSVFGTSLLSIQAASAATVTATTISSTTNIIDTSSSVIDIAHGADVGNYVTSIIDSGANNINMGIETTIYSMDNIHNGRILMETSSALSSSSSSNLIITQNPSSVMESVARSKLQGSWQPGLLEMVLAGRVSDAIGLGDIVFPACLVSWGFAQEKKLAYAYSAVGGYILGSFLTELASTFGPTSIVGQGLPALIFITPAMLGSISLVALQKGDFKEIWGEKEDTK